MVSISIVTYNNEQIIADAMDSIHNSKINFALTTYVVDNASVDCTVSIIKHNYPWVNLIENDENRGFGAANNQALARVESDFHIFMNPDITFEPDLLQDSINWMIDNADTVLINPDIRGGAIGSIHQRRSLG